jgi:hypothetical protein
VVTLAATGAAQQQVFTLQPEQRRPRWYSLSSLRPSAHPLCVEEVLHDIRRSFESVFDCNHIVRAFRGAS